MSVMEKMAKTLNSKDTSLFNTVNQMHKLLGTVGKSGNTAVAQQASNFLNWLIFNNFSSDGLTETFREELLKNDPEIQAIVQKFNIYANLSLSVISPSQQGIFSNKRGAFTEEGLIKIANHYVNQTNNNIQFTGKDQITVFVPKYLNELFPEIGEEINRQAQLELTKSGRRLRFVNKNMKIDSQASQPNLNITFTIQDKDLQKDLMAVRTVMSSATIKSQNDIKKIHLEDVTIEKAYSAFIQFSKKKNMKQKDIKNLFNKYYKTKEFKSDPYITAHLNHLIKTYALTGMGTTLSSDLKTVLQGAQYLVIINNSKKQINIIPTKKIIQDIFFKNNYTKGIVSEIYLNLEPFKNS